jgi:hypothetical protein
LARISALSRQSSTFQIPAKAKPTKPERSSPQQTRHLPVSGELISGFMKRMRLADRVNYYLRANNINQRLLF